MLTGAGCQPACDWKQPFGAIWIDWCVRLLAADLCKLARLNALDMRHGRCDGTRLVAVAQKVSPNG